MSLELKTKNKSRDFLTAFGMTKIPFLVFCSLKKPTEQEQKDG